VVLVPTAGVKAYLNSTTYGEGSASYSAALYGGDDAWWITGMNSMGGVRWIKGCVRCARAEYRQGGAGGSAYATFRGAEGSR